MPVKKYKPQSPDPYVGKIKGDTEFARLAHLNDMVDQVNNNSGASYKSYVAKMSQTGTSNPVVTEVYNDTGWSLTWTRGNVGQYGTGTVQGDISKVVTFISNGLSSPAAAFGSTTYIQAANAFGNNFAFGIRTFASTTNGTTIPSVGLSDNILNEASIEIRVYP